MTKKMSEYKYIVWVNNGYEGWSWTGYDTLEEALRHEGYGNEKAITRPVRFEIKEIEEGEGVR